MSRIPVTPLDRLTIPSPCTADWDSMNGNDQVRFCSHCSLSVHNLSEMTRAEAMALVRKSQGRLCVRYYRRPDGAIQTATDKLRGVKRRASRIAAGAFTATLTLCASVAAQSPSPPSVSDPVQIVNPSHSAGVEKQGGWDGVLNGTIVDSQGGVIPNCKVTLVDQQTKLEWTTTTDNEGAFCFQALSSGDYSLKTEEIAGFAATEMRDIKLPTMNGNSIITLTVVPAEYGTVTVGGAGIVEPREALVSAAYKDDLAAVKELIASGADVNIKDEDIEATALMEAVQNGNHEMVKVLLNAGARVNLKNNHGQTALMYINGRTSPEIVWTLVSAGAKVNRKDKNGETASIGAAEEENALTLQALLDAGAKVNDKNNEGQTALMEAAFWGHIENVRVLLAAGADVNRKNEDGETALSLALDHGSSEIVSVLEAYGARE